MIVRFLIFIFSLKTCMADTGDVHYLENGKLKLGLTLSSGGGIFYLSTKKGENVLNSRTPAQFIQQSYYGALDGSKWRGRHWVWNPVQGRDEGSSVDVLEFKKSPEAVYIKFHPLHWATGEVMRDCYMEQWVILKERIAHIRYRFFYSGELIHPLKSQEIPSIYLKTDYHRLSFYSGEKPWKGGSLESFIPGWPNKTYQVSEPWVAYVNEENIGLGVMLPSLKKFTCYRFKEDSAKLNKDEDFSYFAPIKKIAIEKNKEFLFDVFLTLGKLENIRTRFKELSDNTIKKGEP